MHYADFYFSLDACCSITQHTRSQSSQIPIISSSLISMRDKRGGPRDKVACSVSYSFS